MDAQAHQKQLGLAIREARIKAGLTQKQLGDMVGVTQQSINLIENGKRRFDLYLFLDIRSVLKKFNQVLLPEDPDYFSGFEQLEFQEPLSSQELLRKKKGLKRQLLEQYENALRAVKEEIDSLSVEAEDLQNRINKLNTEIYDLEYQISKEEKKSQTDPTQK